MNFRILVCGALIMIFAFFIVPAVSAHGGQPRLEISVERINPGGVVDVRGVDFEFEEQVTLALVGTEIEIPLGEITADTDGIFLQIVTLPIDLKEGAYHFQAITDDHEVLSPSFIVQGSAISGEEGGGQGLRDEEDSLLAPMPTPGPAASPTPVPSTPVESMPVFNWKPITLVLGLLLLIGAAVALSFKSRRMQ